MIILAGDFFDSVSCGVQLKSDDNMLPDSLKGFAPVVRWYRQKQCPDND